MVNANKNFPKTCYFYRKMYSVRKFIELCALELGWNGKGVNGIIWEGEGLKEIGRADTGEIVIRIDPDTLDQPNFDELLGDSSKAREKLNWEPKISIEELISEMMKKIQRI